MAKPPVKTDNKRPVGNATSYDVARLAGVSQSAVSRCFKPDASISEKMRTKVLAAAAELHYAPNAIARSLITRRSNIVAVLITEATTRATPEILFQLNVALMRQGLHLLLFSITEEMGHGDIIGEVLRYKVDGVIACTSLPQAQIERCQQQGIPVALVNRVAPGQPVCSVSCDHASANRDIASRLYRSGHRRFAFIAGAVDAPVSQQRLHGYAQGLVDLGAGEATVVHGDFSYQSGRDRMRELLALDTPFDAVVCANDDMALGAMDAARYDKNLRVPQDISIVGFDDVAASERPPYRLTTVRQPVEDMARTVVRLLVDRIGDPDLPPVVTLMPGELIVRASARMAVE